MHKFDDDLKCPHGKNVNDLLNRKTYCTECIDDSARHIANRSVLGHLWDSIVCLFDFDLIGMFTELQWSIERLTKTGDYNPKTGEFYKNGYLKNK
jgi:hypothetical protein